MSGDRDRSAAEIERDLHGTRAALARTLDRIEDRLRTRHLMQEGLAMVTESFAEPGGGNNGVVALLRANPIAFALIGAGAAWLLAGNTRLLDRIAEDERVQGTVKQIADLAGTIGDGAAAGAAAAGGWVHRAAGAVRDTGSHALARAEDYSGHAGTRAGRAAGDLWKNGALLVGVAGVVAGAVLAASLPTTRFEAD